MPLISGMFDRVRIDRDQLIRPWLVVVPASAVDSLTDSSYTPRYLDGSPVFYRTEVVTIRAEIAPILWKPTAGPRKNVGFAVYRVFVDARDVRKMNRGAPPMEDNETGIS